MKNTQLMKKLFLAILYLIFTWQNTLAQETASTLPVCGTDDSKMSTSTLALVQNAQKYIESKKSSRMAANITRVARIAIEIDYDTYQSYKGDTNLLKKDAIRQMSMVSKVFEQEMNIRLVVSYINIWTNAKDDPYYNTNNIFEMLSRVNNVWNSSSSSPKFVQLRSQYDKVMYITTKNFTGAGGVAYLSGKESVNPWFRIGTIAHELGHSFGSPHTQSCSWPGGPIDYCYAAEGACYDKALDFIKGSVMSYCNSLGSFHPLTRAVIEQHANTNVAELSANIQTVHLVDEYPIAKAPYFLWEPSIMAEQYIVQIAKDTNFDEIVSQDTTTVQYTNFDNQLTSGSTYYVRVKAINRLGSAEWSNTAKIIVSASSILPPKTINIPKSWILDLAQNNVLKVQPSANATQYEIQFTSTYDYQFSSSVQSVFFAENETKIKLNSSYNTSFWRIRTIVDTLKGAWSDPKTVLIYNSNDWVNDLHTEHLTNPSAGMTLFTYDYITNGSAQVTLKISPSNDLSKVVYEKTYSPFSYSNSKYIFRIPSLENNKSYQATLEYNMLEEYPLSYYPKGVIAQKVKTFVYQKANIDTNHVAYMGFDNIPFMGNFDLQGAITPKHFIYKSQIGIILFDLQTLAPTVLNNQTTQGALGILNTKGVYPVGENQIAVIAQMSRRLEYDGSFPKPAYAINTIDNNTLNFVSSTNISLPSNFSFYKYDTKTQYIYGYTYDKGEYIIAKIENNTFKTLLKITPPRSNLNSYSAPIWNNEYLFQRFYNNSGYTLVRYKFSDGSFTEFSNNDLENIYSSINYDFIDSKGRYWASQNNSLIMFDGTKWTRFNQSNSLITRPYVITENPTSGDIFVFDNNSILKFFDNQWSELGKIQLSVSGLSSMYVDINGLFWFLYDGFVIRYNPCTGEYATPTITPNPSSIEYGQQVSLTAQGCEKQVLWNWNSTKEKGAGLYNQSPLEASPLASTEYVAKCYYEGCTGKEANTKITVIPIVRIDSVSTVCLNQPLKVYGRVLGDFEPTNSFTQIIQSNGKEVNIKPYQIIHNTDNQVVWLSNITSLNTGDYTVHLEGSLPKAISKDTVQGKILPIPPIKITSPPACEGQTLQMSATGGQQYSFFLNNRTLVSTNDHASIETALLSTNQSYAKVIGYGANGCQNSDSTRITVHALPQISINAPSQVYQSGDLTLGVNGASTYNWTGPANFVASSAAITILNVQLANAGVYSVRGIDQNGCTNTAEVKIEVLIPLSTQEEINQAIKVFPNPASDILSVQTSLKDDVQLNITDSQGRYRYMSTFRQSTQIPLREFTSGVYFIHLRNTNTETFLKFIVQ